MFSLARRTLLALIPLVAACDKSASTPPPAASTPSPSTPTTSLSAPSNTAALTPPPAAETAMPKDAADLAKGSNDLAFELYGRIRGSAGNLAISPASISSALAMTYGGARGETAAQMKKTMHFPGEPAATMTSWGNTTRALVAPARPMKIRMANRLFGEKSYSFEAPYLEAAQTAFGAPIESLDFKHGPDAARAHINGWVEERTEKRIKDLLPATSINGETRLVLVNAIYYLADWEEPFDKTWTKDEPFHTTATTQKNVPTMKRTEHVPLAKTNGARVVELAYKGNQTAMWIVLPDAVDGLAEVEKGFTGATLDSWRSKLSVENVRVELPRFEVNPKESLSLAGKLKELGMTDAFEREKANFTGIANPSDPRERLFIANVFHKAFVKTDENGTEAAGATAVEMARAGGMPQKPVDFKVDRPFLFLIVEKSTSLVLFMGRVSDPQGG
ncbi:MAG: serpin family protein [Labilithrix sp.]